MTDYLAEIAALDTRAFSYFNRMREIVLTAAADGRATYLPAGARDNTTARVLIDGVEVGQASSLLGESVRTSLSATTFGECAIYPRERPYDDSEIAAMNATRR